MGNMPARSPPTGKGLAAALAVLGKRIKARRKALGISATVAAEAAGMSRVTLHRIEKGEPSVTMGAYMGAITALGLSLELADPQATKKRRLPTTIRLADYPQLRRLAWQLKGTDEVAPREALDLYERNWRHVDQDAMDAHERDLVSRLAAVLGGGRLLV